MNSKKCENFSEIKKRIVQYLENQKIKREDFYKRVSINGANFRGLSAKSELSSDKIANILQCYPEINPDWLLLGAGEMLRNPNNKDNKNTTTTSNDNLQSLIEILNHTITEKDKQIDRLLTIIENFK